MVILKQIVETFTSTLKKLFKKMGLNVKGKFLSGKDAKEKIERDKAVSNTGLTETEIKFILSKLRDANFKGAEFELFYIVFNKLSNLLPKK